VRKKRTFRFLLRLAVLHVFVLAAFVLPAWAGRFIIPALSPHIAIVASVAARAIGLASAVGAAMLVIVAWRRRWFCRWLCPVGLIVDSCAKARPRAKYAYRKIPPIGQWFALATLGGAIVGWPLLLWLDPLSIFTASLNASVWPVDIVAAVSLGAMAFIVLLSLVLPKFWCLRLCPLGGTQDLLFGVVRRAMRLRGDEGTSFSGVALARRSAIFAGLGAAGGLLVSRSLRARTDPLPKIRPPGAVDEAAFKGLCVRCGNCVRACPKGIIYQDVRLSDPAGLLTPAIRFEAGVKDPKRHEEYCHETCNACTQVCPTGAIEAMALPAKLRRVIGLAEVNMSECLLKDGAECGICTFRDLCPRGAISLGTVNIFDPDIVIDPEKCNGCGACEVICPAQVITIRPCERRVLG